MFTWPLKRGCYQPRSRCMFPFTLGYRFARTHMRACAQRGAFELARAHVLPPARPSRRACLCQQMSGRRCVFLCLSLCSFHLLLQRLPICLPPRFILSHSSPPPRSTTSHHPRGQQRVYCVSDTLALFIRKRRSCFPQPTLLSSIAQRRTRSAPQKAVSPKSAKLF